MSLILQVVATQVLKQFITEERTREVLEIITEKNISFEDLFNPNGINPILGISSSEWKNIKEALAIEEEKFETLDLYDCLPWFKFQIANKQNGQPALYLQSDEHGAPITIIQTFLIDKTIKLGMAPLKVLYTNEMAESLKQSFNNQKLIILT
ncbi:hypothetical protein GKZ89_19340 [Bacillus mangrovi]|uniref:Uncharacterized protein n=1 Tax=Metabacillus mangrovi TaxID=1491830 RepID=A0A7X2S8X6_9BACI|nr:hypothetical protein [Metabacillus mangrovi]MTH55552.1 hypothetical protein [Metabacillus mangrovi]